MEGFIALLLVLGIAASGGLVLLEVQTRRARDRRWQTVRLHFGRDVTPEAVVAFLDAIAGLHRHASVVLDVHADHQGISHHLSSDQATHGHRCAAQPAHCCQACASSRSTSDTDVVLPLRPIHSSARSAQGAAKRRPDRSQRWTAGRRAAARAERAPADPLDAATGPLGAGTADARTNVAATFPASIVGC